MANLLSPWAIGSNVRITAQPLTRSGTDYSIVALGSAIPFLGKIQSYGVDYSLHTSDMTPMDAFTDNPVIYGATETITITAFESPLDTYAGGVTSPIRKMLEQSFYHKLTIQLGTVSGGTFTATKQEVSYVQFAGRSLAGGRESVMSTGTFQIIPVVDSATGLYIANPDYTNP